MLAGRDWLGSTCLSSDKIRQRNSRHARPTPYETILLVAEPVYVELLDDKRRRVVLKGREESKLRWSYRNGANEVKFQAAGTSDSGYEIQFVVHLVSIASNQINENGKTNVLHHVYRQRRRNRH